MAADGARFSCEGCGKTYAWKPELAGRRVKCKCGHVMTVMQAPPQPEPELDEDALYDLADAETEAAKKSPAQNAPYVSRVAAVAVGAGTGAATATAAVVPGRAAPTIGYQRGPTLREKDRFSNKTLIDMKRDCSVPVALIILGFSLYVGYYAVRFELGGVGITAVTFGLGLITLFKVALLFGFAFYTAGPLGVSYGGPLTALLKLAAISVFCDGLTQIVDGGMSKLAGPGFSGGVLGYSMISFPVALAAYWAMLIYLFDMDQGDSWYVVILLACFDYIVRLVLMIMLLRLVLGWGGVSAASVPVPTFGSASAAVADPMVEKVSQMKELNQLVEARKYIADGHQAVLAKTVDDWYAAGCKNVWFTVTRDINGRATPFGVLVELPAEKDKRAKCYTILGAYYDGAGISYDPQDLKDSAEKYLTVGIR